jgi:hypothetical protein
MEEHFDAEIQANIGQKMEMKSNPRRVYDAYP